MLLPLSYPISRRGPLYPGTPAVEFHEVKSEKKLSSISTTISMNTHTSTHIDAPVHFCGGGRTVAEALSRWNEFSPAYCLDIPLSGPEGMTAAVLDGLPKEIERASALLLRTGMHRSRNSDPVRYSEEHPYFEPSLAEALVARMPSLRAVGIDCVSIALPGHRDEGTASHRALLCRDRPVLIIEDLDLSDPRLVERPFRLFVLPVLWDDLDGTPVVAFAETP